LRGVIKLRKLKLKYGWYGGDSEAFIYYKFIFVTSSHARGKNFHIYLVEDNKLSDDMLKEKAFEVYGILGGQNGWTEYYGWLHEGNWVKYVIDYFKRLKNEIEEVNLVEEKRKIDINIQAHKSIKNTIDMFNKIFT
jgi:hypothetical protein